MWFVQSTANSKNKPITANTTTEPSARHGHRSAHSITSLLRAVAGLLWSRRRNCRACWRHDQLVRRHCSETNLRSLDKGTAERGGNHDTTACEKSDSVCIARSTSLIRSLISHRIFSQTIRGRIFVRRLACNRFTISGLFSSHSQLPRPWLQLRPQTRCKCDQESTTPTVFDTDASFAY